MWICDYGLQITVSNNEMTRFDSITILKIIEVTNGLFKIVELERGLFMCVGYELLLLPNKMQTKTPNREMSVDSAFSASRDTLILHIQDLQYSILLKNSMTLYSFIKYSQMLLLCVKTHDIAFEITIQKRLLFLA